MRAAGIARTVAAIALLVTACGQAELTSRDLALRFSARSIPAGTTSLEVYVLEASESVRCERFVGPEADLDIADYLDALVVPEQSLAYTEGEDPVIAVNSLPLGELIFVVLARGGGEVLAEGCGQGTVTAGEKIFVHITLEAI